MACVCPCPAGPRGFVPAAKLRPYSPAQVQQPGMDLLTPDSGTDRRRHSYQFPEAPRPQVATFTPTFQVRVGDIPEAISSSPTSSLLILVWVGRWSCFSRCPPCWHQGGQGKRTVLGVSPVLPWHCCTALSELPVLPHPSPLNSQLQQGFPPSVLPCLPQVVAGFSFTARSPQEVTLQAGQPVLVLEPHDKKGSTEWSLVEVNGQRGYVDRKSVV